jgi:hypothetical protein
MPFLREPSKGAAMKIVEADEHEVPVDETSRQIRAALSGELSGLYPSLAGAGDPVA